MEFILSVTLSSSNTTAWNLYYLLHYLLEILLHGIYTICYIIFFKYSCMEFILSVTLSSSNTTAWNLYYLLHYLLDDFVAVTFLFQDFEVVCTVWPLVSNPEPETNPERTKLSSFLFGVLTFCKFWFKRFEKKENINKLKKIIFHFKNIDIHKTA